MSDKGVTCQRCGGSTPLPEDLRVPTFACRACGVELSTAAYAGNTQVSADAFLGHLGGLLGTDPSTAARRAHEGPRFQGGSKATREAPCRHCGATLTLSMDLEVRTTTCAGCGRAQSIDDYIPNEERFALDMARQVAGNEALKALLAAGVPCGKCGGQNPVPDDGRVQVVCQFCGTTILLSDHVDASAIARRRLKHGVFAMKDEVLREHAVRQRRLGWVVGGVVAFIVLLIAAIEIIASRATH
ncbi:MAG TPA: hypothetical protein PLR99_06285 [Polyangiaceae bacterium]|nr:hypothetical protein [Polyangiaceae bacterium]